ncbi:MAG: hypothetical protein Q8N71_04410 [candidate division Zixibacteria bacterium]|nr:hypothetical protein [candidate division Zixibacteria bacterium]
MADVKIQFKLGGIEFSGEGEKDWIGQQLDKILEKAPKLVALAPAGGTGVGLGGGRTPMGPDPQIAAKTLAAFLKEKNATSNQVKKFLATAIWLEAKGKRRMITSDVTKALRDSNQARLGNPSDCLNQNVTKGNCEKDGKEFFVTDEGKNSL